MKNSIAIIIAFFVLVNLQAQQDNSRWNASLTFANMRYPFLNVREDGGKEPLFGNKLYPSFSLAVERDWNKSNKNRWFQTLELQYFSYRYIDYGASLISEIGYEHRFWDRLILGMRLGIGRQMAWKNDQYQVYNNGEWQTKNAPGPANGRWMVQPRINLGWQITPHLDGLIGLRAQAIAPFYKPLDVSLNIAVAAEVGARWRF